MPILTLQKTKEILQLTSDDSNDETIKALLPAVQDHVIFNILNNIFANPKVYYQNSTISFDADNDQILDSSSKFISTGKFISDIDVLVSGSKYNDGIYLIKTAEAGALTVDFSYSKRNSFLAETAEESILIQHMQIQNNADLMLPTARLIYYLMQQDSIKGVKSESVLSYSVTYLNELPADIKNLFNGIRKLKW